MVEPVSIPLNDLRRHGAALADTLQEAVREVIAGGHYILGPRVDRFEKAYAAYCGVAHAVGVGNGTDALELALKALGCAAGDEVLTVANAGGYATSAILSLGATPVYADIDPHTMLMSPETFSQAVTPKTRAVIVTHLFGLMADMPALCSLAAARGIAVIEDCAQAHGASIGGRKAGSWGAFGCFSFYPTKNLGAIGDAGCIVTADAAHAGKLRALRQYGWQQAKYHMPQDTGRNSRMDELQAAVLLAFLPHLESWNDRRREVADRYRAALQEHKMVFQQVPDDERFVAHLCVMRCPARDKLKEALRADGITTDVHYPVADYLQPAVRKRIGQRQALPVTEKAVSEVLSLPCFPEITREETDRVIARIIHHSAPGAL
jgi:dTDP-3-amino-2,3,6-trideoxy-4-keto-D-glucose/dTDP-3-amino-3,4,6-trideoxy-alpha-D-glucose/dTDP-2,6-dideoxy-D-kanosamine transaminase